MTRDCYDTTARQLLLDFAREYDPQRPANAKLRELSIKISQHAQNWDPSWYPKGVP